MRKEQKKKIEAYLSAKGFKVYDGINGTKNLYDCNCEVRRDEIFFFEFVKDISLQTIADIKPIFGCKDITIHIDGWGDGFSLIPVYDESRR